MALPAAYAQQGRLLVAQKGDQSLAIVDPSASSVITSVAEGGNTGHEVVASPDGRLAFVPIYGNSGVGKPGTNGQNIAVIDIASQKVIGNISFDHGVRPHDPVFGPKDGLLYVTGAPSSAASARVTSGADVVGDVPLERLARQSERPITRRNGVGGVIADDQGSGVERAWNRLERGKRRLRRFTIDMRCSVHCSALAFRVARLQPAIVAPPSTTMTCPVVNEPALEAR